jgi:periplasmic copper chaperone A
MGIKVGVLAAGALALALGGPASAHVVFNESLVKPGEMATLQLRVTHGCGGTPTREVRVKVPEGVTRVTPRMIPGWQVSVVKRALPAPVTLHGETVRETVDTLVWSGGSLPDVAYEQFELRAHMPATAAGPLYFPVEQICDTGRIDWTNVPARVEDWGRTANPAPYVRLASAAANGPAPKQRRR